MHLSYCVIVLVFQALKKTFEQDLDALNKQQKMLIEKAEQNQQADMKNAAKKLKTEQVSEKV